MRSLLLACLFSSAFLIQVARADGLVYQLPANGVSARYKMEYTNSANGQERTFKDDTLTISSVGETTVDGEKCRWIEFRTMNKRDDQERIYIAKFLIPEKHLGRGKTPAEHVVRGWTKQGDGEPQTFAGFKAQAGGAMAGFLGGPPQNPGELEKVEIDTPLGKLACPAVTGSYEIEQGNATTTFTFERRLNEKAPFGVVSSVMKFERKVNGQVAATGEIKLTLAETGTTALTELPDRN